MTAAGHAWRYDRDGYICVCLALGAEARLPIASPKSNETLSAELANPQTTWGDDQTIHAELIRWLCADPAARPFISHSGVQIAGARISGAINLDFADIPFPLALLRCDIEGALLLLQAKMPMLNLGGSRCRDITADGLDVKGAVLLRYGFHVTGMVRLVGATIDGVLDCSGGTFENPLAKYDADAYALHADGLDVIGGVFLRGGFRATGMVRLPGAAIGGGLDCTGGRFENPRANDDNKAYALCADGLDVEGSVLLNNMFHAIGMVRLLGATIGSNLDCSDGTFENPLANDDVTAHALDADGLEVKGDVFLSRYFHAIGMVRLLGARIGGDLACVNGKFEHPRAESDPNSFALAADRLDVKGSVFLCKGFLATGTVRLPGVAIGGDLECTGGRFENPRAKDDAEACALDADGLEVKGSIFLNSGFRATGEVSLVGSTIGGSLKSAGGKFIALRASFALNAQGVSVGGDVEFTDRFHAKGAVTVVGATINGDLYCEHSWFDNSHAAQNASGSTRTATVPSLDAERANIGGAFLIRGRSWFGGDVSLLQARVGKILQIKGDGLFAIKRRGRRSRREKREHREKRDVPTSHELDVRDAHVGVLDDTTASWPAPERLLAEGFRYDAIDDEAPRSASARLEWLGLMPQDQFRAQPYTQLANVLRASGDRAGAREVLIARETARYKYRTQLANVLRASGDRAGAREVLIARETARYKYRSPDGGFRPRASHFITTFPTRLLGWTIGYGFAPFRTLRWLFGLYVIGLVVFTYASEAASMAPVRLDDAYGHLDNAHRAVAIAGNDVHPAYPTFNPWVYAFDAMAPLIDLYQRSNWVPDTSKPVGRWVMRYLWAHTFFGWMFTTLFFVGLTGIATPKENE